jgi:hypothetical protein
MLLHAHVVTMRLSLAHSVFLGAFQEALVKAVKVLKKACTNCVYVWNKCVHGNHTFYIRNQTDLTECVWKNYVQNYALWSSQKCEAWLACLKHVFILYLEQRTKLYLHIPPVHKLILFFAYRTALVLQMLEVANQCNNKQLKTNLQTRGICK